MTLPVDPMLLAMAIFVLLVLVSGGCLYYAVKEDAAARGANAGFWSLAVFFLMPVAGPIYVFHRRRLPERTDAPDRTERWVGAVGIGGTTTVFLASVLTPPDPFSLVSLALPLAAVAIPLATIICYGVDPRTFGFWTP